MAVRSGVMGQGYGRDGRRYCLLCLFCGAEEAGVEGGGEGGGEVVDYGDEVADDAVGVFALNFHDAATLVLETAADNHHFFALGEGCADCAVAVGHDGGELADGALKGVELCLRNRGVGTAGSAGGVTPGEIAHIAQHRADVGGFRAEKDDVADNWFLLKNYFLADASAQLFDGIEHLGGLQLFAEALEALPQVAERDAAPQTHGVPAHGIVGEHAADAMGHILSGVGIGLTLAEEAQDGKSAGSRAEGTGDAVRLVTDGDGGVRPIAGDGAIYGVPQGDVVFYQVLGDKRVDVGSQLPRCAAALMQRKEVLPCAAGMLPPHDGGDIFITEGEVGGFDHGCLGEGHGALYQGEKQ